MSGIDGIGQRQQVGSLGDVGGVGGTVPTGTAGVNNTPPQVTLQSAMTTTPQLSTPQPDATSPERLNSLIDTLIKQGPDFSQIMVMVQQEQVKTDKEQLVTQQKMVDGKKNEIKANTESDIKKLNEQIKKIEDQQKASLFKRIFGWIAVAVSVIAAIATGGALAIGVALVGAAVFALQDTGVMNKLLKDLPQWAQITIMVVITVALVAGGIAGASTSAGGLVARLADGAVNIAKKAGMIAQAVGGVAKLGEGGAGIASSVITKDVAEMEADRKDINAAAMRLKKEMDEMMEKLQQLVAKMEDSVRATTSIVRSEADSVSFQMRAMKS
jgi:hypothetical protein